MINDLLYNGVIGAIVGSVLGVALSFIAKSVYDSRRGKKSLADLRSRLARSFWAEITALFDLYESLKLDPWMSSEEGVIYKMVNIQYDYISIFNSNADKIGLFPPEDAAEFVRFYTFTKFYIDTLRELSRRWLNHAQREEKHRLDPENSALVNVYKLSEQDLFELYQHCYEQQEEFYARRDAVKKTFEKYL